MTHYGHIMCRNPMCGKKYSKELTASEYKRLHGMMEGEDMVSTDCKYCKKPTALGMITESPKNPMFYVMDTWKRGGEAPAWTKKGGKKGVTRFTTGDQEVALW